MTHEKFPRIPLPAEINAPCCGVWINEMIDHAGVGRLPIEGERIDCHECGAEVEVVADGLKVVSTANGAAETVPITQKEED